MCGITLQSRPEAERQTGPGVPSGRAVTARAVPRWGWGSGVLRAGGGGATRRLRRRSGVGGRELLAGRSASAPLRMPADLGALVAARYVRADDGNRASMSTRTHVHRGPPRHDAAMTTSSTEPRRRRGRRPWSRRTPRAADLAIGIPLLLLGAGLLVLDAMFGHGLEIWAAQGDLGRIETADLAYMARLQNFLVVVLVVAVLALVSRAPWTVLSQVLAAILAGVMLTAAQHSWDRSHPPRPVRRPKARCRAIARTTPSAYRVRCLPRVPRTPDGTPTASSPSSNVSGKAGRGIRGACARRCSRSGSRRNGSGRRVSGSAEPSACGRRKAPRFETDHYITPEGASVGVRVHGDACVTAFVQKTNHVVRTNGPYLEGGWSITLRTARVSYAPKMRPQIARHTHVGQPASPQLTLTCELEPMALVKPDSSPVVLSHPQVHGCSVRP